MPETGQFAEGVQAQTAQALRNVKAVLEAAGSGLDKVVKTTVFLKDMNDFAQVNEVYGSFSPNRIRRAAPSRWPACPRTVSSKSKSSP
ncbi:hypothetical protein HMSSN036_93050 [Paenibacillus macerans]|nr:hypothetical protein HMSSN036_93050 [Paenibacillus macerans]